MCESEKYFLPFRVPLISRRESCSGIGHYPTNTKASRYVLAHTNTISEHCELAGLIFTLSSLLLHVKQVCCECQLFKFLEWFKGELNLCLPVEILSIILVYRLTIRVTSFSSILLCFVWHIGYGIKMTKSLWMSENNPVPK